MFKDFFRYLLGRRPSEFDSLILNAMKVDRYSPYKFSFRGMNIEVTDFLSVAYQIKEYFGDNRMDFKSNRKDPLIIDCGANVGISIIRYRQLFPDSKIIAFEPDEKVFNCLSRNISNNNISKVELFQKAIWKDHNGVNFGSEGADGGSVFYSENKKVVESLRLKDLLSSYSEIDLLKIDIEGAEVEVLLDCDKELKRVKNLFVEYHSFSSESQRLDELLHALKQNGFRYYIHSISTINKSPFVKIENTPMDIQLDIHAIRQ